MPTQLTLHKTFAECEALQRIERLQGQFHVFLSDETGELIALSSNMQPDRAHEFLQAVDFVQLKAADRPQITRVLGIDLFYHRNSDGLWCFEFDPLTPQIKPLDIRLDPAMPNVVRNAQALQVLLDQSREQAHILRRDIEAASETCSLGKLIQEVSDDFTLSANERALSIRLELPKPEVWVNGARASIRQIVINLLSNAMKFSNPGQSIEIHLEQDRDFAILRVEDSGMGMTTQQAASATEPFVRFSDRPGSGLGLSIVNQLIQANGGQLTIESELGKGTRVETRIPLAVNRMDMQKPVAGLLVN